MVLSRSFFLVVLIEYVSAGVIHDGVDINAKLPAPIQIPGLDLGDELFAINTNHTVNESGRKSLVVTQNVTVRTPFLSVQYTNTSVISKDDLKKSSSIVGQGLPFLPKAADLDEAVEYLNIPVRVAELAKLATADSPGQFREKFNSSPLLDSILADIEDKSKYYHEVTNLLNQGNAVASQLLKKPRVKREAIFNLEQGVERLTTMIPPPSHKRLPREIGSAQAQNQVADSPTSSEQLRKEFSSPEIDSILADIEDKSKYYLNQGKPLANQQTKKGKTKRQALFNLEQNVDGITVMVAPEPQSMLPQEIDLAQLQNQSGFTLDDVILGKASPSSDRDGYAPVGRLVLPHLLHLLIHPHHLASASRLHHPHRPVPRPPHIHPIIRPLFPASSLLPIVRAFASPTVIRSLLEVIPQLPPILAPREDQVIHPPITSYPPYEYHPYSMYDQSKPPASLYGYEKPPLDSEFNTLPNKKEERILSPLENHFSTLFQDFPLTR